MSGICGILAAFSAGVSGMVPIASGTGFVWWPDGIKGRTSEALSSRDLRGGEEVGAFDAIDSKLPLASRSVFPKSVTRNAFESVTVESRVLDK